MKISGKSGKIKIKMPPKPAAGKAPKRTVTVSKSGKVSVKPGKSTGKKTPVVTVSKSGKVKVKPKNAQGKKPAVVVSRTGKVQVKSKSSKKPSVTVSKKGAVKVKGKKPAFGQKRPTVTVSKSGKLGIKTPNMRKGEWKRRGIPGSQTGQNQLNRPVNAGDTQREGEHFILSVE